MFEDVLVRDADGFRYYTNDFSMDYQKRMMDYDNKGTATNELFRVFLVEEIATGVRAYVAFRKNGMPFMNWTCPEEFEVKMMLYRDNLRENANIVRMAKRRLKDDSTHSDNA